MSLRMISALLGLVLALPFMTHCSAVHFIDDDARPRRRAFLRFEVEPEETMILVDGEYRGEIRAWRAGVVPVVAGDRQVELRADGYITQRFDLRVDVDEEVTLRLKLEPLLGIEATRQEGPASTLTPRLR